MNKRMTRLGGLWACLLTCFSLAGGARAGQNGGTATGSPTYAASTGFGQALVTNGTSQYVQATTLAQGWGANCSWTIEARLQTTAAVTQVAVSVIRPGDLTTPTPNAWLGMLGTGHAAFGPSGFNAGSAIDSGVAINDGAWHSLALCCVSGTTVRCFVDGVLTNTLSGQFLAIPSAVLYVGTLALSQGTPVVSWMGQIDEVAVSDTAIYAASYTPASASLANNRGSQGQISLYHFDGDGADAALPPYLEGETVSPSGQAMMYLLPGPGPTYAPPTPGAPLVLYCHGSGEDNRALLTDGLKAGVVQAFAAAGYVLAGSAAHGPSNWGNQASVDDYADLYNFAAANYNSANCLVWSQSMGGLDGLSVLSQGKVPNVVGWLGTYPVCSLSAVYNGTGGGTNFSAAINTAYGITGSGAATYANLTFGMDPLLKWGNAFRNVPMRFYASPGDTVVAKSANTDPFAALVATSSREHVVVVCDGNHGGPDHFQPSDYLAFAQRCFANPVATSGPVIRTRGSRPAYKGGH